MSVNSLSKDSLESKQFHQLLDEIRQEVDELKDHIDELEKENKELSSELAEYRKKENDPFSSMENKERMVLKHQIQGLVTKIDKHLNIES